MKTHLSRTGSRVLMAVAVVGLVLSASACGGSENTSDTSAATEQWAGSVCTALTDWKTSLADAKSTLESSGLSEASLKQASSDAQDANQTLARTLQNLGKPEAASGEKAGENLADLETSLSFSIGKIKETVQQPASSPAELATELTTVKQAIGTMTAALGTAITNLKQYDPSGELETAFQDAPSCSEFF